MLGAGLLIDRQASASDTSAAFVNSSTLVEPLAGTFSIWPPGGPAQPRKAQVPSGTPAEGLAAQAYFSSKIT